MGILSTFKKMHRRPQEKPQHSPRNEVTICKTDSTSGGTSLQRNTVATSYITFTAIHSYMQ